MKKLGNRGNASIILCAAIVGLLGFTAGVVDIGMVYVQRVKLSNAIDSAVLAASMELVHSESKTMTVAREYLEKNNIDPSSVSIAIGPDSKSLEIKGTKTVKHLFAPIIGINTSDVKVSTKAIIGPVKAVRGDTRPFAVQKFDYNYGDIVTLKENAGDAYRGNYKAVALGGTGANVFRDNALHGFSGKL